MKSVQPTKRKPKVQEIDADTWAESGGTGGIYGYLWRAGKLKIVETPLDGSQIVPEL